MADLKDLWDSVDNARKAWALIVFVGGALLGYIGVSSQSLRLAMILGSFCGCILSYWFTAAHWGGKGEDACKRRSKWYLGFFWIPLLVVIAMIVVLEPETARAISAEKVYEFLVRSRILPNLIGFIGCFVGLYLLVGAIVLTSPSLWTHRPTP